MSCQQDKKKAIWQEFVYGYNAKLLQANRKSDPEELPVPFHHMEPMRVLWPFITVENEAKHCNFQYKSRHYTSGIVALREIRL